MKKIGLTDNRLQIEGLYGFEGHGRFRRYTDEIVSAYPRLSTADRKSVGARLRFRTDSKRIRVQLRLSNQFVDRGMSFYQANTAYAFVGPYDRAAYAALLSADEPYKDETIYADFGNDGMNDVTVFFPQNPTVEDVCVYLEDGAALEKPTPHRIALPFVFYGSSITQQGHTSSFLAYPSLLSRLFDADFYNFGASGNAMGEPELALHLGAVPKSIFFYDYDHNAPTAEHLRQTHEAFFRLFRSVDPLTPVIMTSRPADDTAETAERTAIIRTTYENARRGGDRNVYFLDGLTLFGDADPALCTTDRTHPNDLGHYMIAATLEGLIRRENLLDPDASSAARTPR
ncbi:MAG: hypothetical protein IJT44_09605 [Clostridia bacterium]|nr:hypothetical protein [Clostridia bacterium]